MAGGSGGQAGEQVPGRGEPPGFYSEAVGGWHWALKRGGHMVGHLQLEGRWECEAEGQKDVRAADGVGAAGGPGTRQTPGRQRRPEAGPARGLLCTVRGCGQSLQAGAGARDSDVLG